MAKVKAKTKKAAKARFRVTATGKLVRTRPGKRHILTKKTTKRKRRLRGKDLVSDTQVKMYRRLIGA